MTLPHFVGQPLLCHAFSRSIPRSCNTKVFSSAGFACRISYQSACQGKEEHCSESEYIQPKESQPQISIRLSRAELSASGHGRQTYCSVRMLALCSQSTRGTSHAPLSQKIPLLSQKAELR